MPSTSICFRDVNNYLLVCGLLIKSLKSVTSLMVQSYTGSRPTRTVCKRHLNPTRQTLNPKPSVLMPRSGREESPSRDQISWALPSNLKTALPLSSVEEWGLKNPPEQHVRLLLEICGRDFSACFLLAATSRSLRPFLCLVPRHSRRGALNAELGFGAEAPPLKAEWLFSHEERELQPKTERSGGTDIDMHEFRV